MCAQASESCLPLIRNACCSVALQQSMLVCCSGQTTCLSSIRPLPRKCPPLCQPSQSAWPAESWSSLCAMPPWFALCPMMASCDLPRWGLSMLLISHCLYHSRKSFEIWGVGVGGEGSCPIWLACWHPPHPTTPPSTQFENVCAPSVCSNRAHSLADAECINNGCTFSLRVHLLILRAAETFRPLSICFGRTPKFKFWACFREAHRVPKLAFSSKVMLFAGHGGAGGRSGSVSVPTGPPRSAFQHSACLSAASIPGDQRGPCKPLAAGAAAQCGSASPVLQSAFCSAITPCQTKVYSSTGMSYAFHTCFCLLDTWFELCCLTYG